MVPHFPIGSLNYNLPFRALLTNIIGLICGDTVNLPYPENVSPNCGVYTRSLASADRASIRIDLTVRTVHLKPRNNCFYVNARVVFSYSIH